jgi:hypothetical protein
MCASLTDAHMLYEVLLAKVLKLRCELAVLPQLLAVSKEKPWEW